MNISILIGLAALVVTITVIIYNVIVAKKQMVDNGWADIDVQLKRRADLIPNLVEVVKGYASHERDTLEEIIETRNRVLGSDEQSKAREEGETSISRGLTRLFALAEAYPDLKANEQFLSLQEQLSKTEDEISFARRFFNGAVREYNTAIKSFPSNLLAAPLGFKEAQFFEIEPVDRLLPGVGLGPDQ
ncbi:LemA family protein [Ponticaulis sp.]|uniref:LemA family protein n=1 Tax=Ponticaulis sp. TaxID=2020902 RepID=UPI000C954C39|nr:LemA family protein [Ponticaulis sp.]MAI91127.1 hypothetical protein [Ponticaulis sp.]|tara:strand:+ start:10358 stop:10921 length:564 start_codon:yes stop_codon:yes gene_type:complete